ncbi:uncharacterized protein LOC128559340 [Mercenaria mercenaria]|uniref:uncharacterized protein LOC128559340 n=1 Tax=Mercenaria mercenaria TaxID=6596 RepID=UPI00234F3D5F|nr:uncharacterized protein LOC128559340 [Mercenaria mercenaria]
MRRAIRKSKTNRAADFEYSVVEISPAPNKNGRRKTSKSNPSHTDKGAHQATTGRSRKHGLTDTSKKQTLSNTVNGDSHSSFCTWLYKTISYHKSSKRQKHSVQVPDIVSSDLFQSSDSDASASSDSDGSDDLQFREPHTPASSTKISNLVSPKLKRKIWKHKFVDFNQLLNTNPNHNSYSLQLDSQSNINLVPNKRQKVLSIELRTSAFLRFVAVYSVKFPLETPALMKCGEMVRELASMRPGSAAWSDYNVKFRSLRESKQMPWDQLHYEYWIMVTTPPAVGRALIFVHPGKIVTDPPFVNTHHSNLVENNQYTSKIHAGHTIKGVSVTAPNAPTPMSVVSAEGHISHNDVPSAIKLRG